MWVSGLPVGLSTYPQKKQPEHYAANQVEGLSNDLVRLPFFTRERWDQKDIQGVRVYYQGFDPDHSHFTYLNQKLWKTLRKFNTTPGSWALTLHDYQRKVAEGKNKMSIINAVRNKLLHRVVAVIKRGTPYQIQLQKSVIVKT